MSENHDLLALARRVRTLAVVPGNSSWLSNGEHREMKNGIAILKRELGAVVPHDFEFLMIFEMDGLHLQFRFGDGNTVFESQDTRFISFEKMMAKTRNVDWSSLRSELIAHGGRLEHVVELAADRPANLPSSDTAAREYAVELQELSKQFPNLVNALGIHLLFAREGTGLDYFAAKTREHLVAALVDLLPLENHVVAVIQNGRWWDLEQIEAAKLEALDLCGPISRARAERRILPEDFTDSPITTWPFSEPDGATFVVQECVPGPAMTDLKS